MGKAYFCSRISENISKTPEGFMICKNVPLARTGVQDYMGTEIGMNDSAIYKVTRPEKEVFSKSAMASFEGKPVCDEHPPVDVDSDNYKAYMKGIVRDVRRGSDRFADCMMGDLIIYDHDLAKAIEDGKREISGGYDCLWVQTDDRAFEQRDIRGNHVAVVEKGRAGKKVAIRDQAPEKIKRRSGTKMSILKKMFESFVKDAEPGEILEASKLVNGDPGGDAPAKKPEAPAMDAAIDERFKKIEDALNQLCAPKQQAPVQDVDPDMDNEQGAEPDGDESTEALDALEGELAEGGNGEEAVTEDPEDINGEAEDAEPAEEDVDPEAEPVPAPTKATRDAAMEAIRAMRPLLAQIPNPLQRKKAADSLAVMIRGQVRDEQYKVLLNAQRASVKKTMDSTDERELGKKWRDQFNPHYKKSE